MLLIRRSLPFRLRMIQADVRSSSLTHCCTVSVLLCNWPSFGDENATLTFELNFCMLVPVLYTGSHECKITQPPLRLEPDLAHTQAPCQLL